MCKFYCCADTMPHFMNVPWKYRSAEGNRKIFPRTTYLITAERNRTRFDSAPKFKGFDLYGCSRLALNRRYDKSDRANNPERKICIRKRNIRIFSKSRRFIIALFSRPEALWAIGGSPFPDKIMSLGTYNCAFMCSSYKVGQFNFICIYRSYE